jgi:alcohol dehydrogenase (cytochrome c)
MTRSRRFWWGVLALLVLLVLVAGVGVASGHLRWRAAVVLEKATGRLPELGWGDLIWMLRPDSGIYLEPLVDSPNPFEVIENPRRSRADAEAGKRLYDRLCNSCHGDEARGGAGGPSLRERVYRQGRRPWALYRTITLGIPGTAMVGRNLPRDDVWRLVGYLETVLAGSGMPADEAPPARVQPVSADELRAAAPSEWLTYSGSYDGQRHSGLDQINRDSVRTLRVEWVRQLPQVVDESLETSPIVRGATMFVTQPNGVLALDARSGEPLWTFSRELPAHLSLCCGSGNRGVAVLGEQIFVGTLDAHLIALDAATGRVRWNITVADHSAGYSITAAPLAVDDLVITGVGGGEYDTRGFVDAYDAASGQRRWRFYTVPAPGEPGSETWPRAALSTGGAPTWMTGSFDPQLRLLYWGVGNPHPDYYGETRRGDNLYSNSMLALDVDSGRLRWYFQFTPHDLHDWDSAQTPVLADALVGDAARKVLALANRNGFYYLLDRLTGEFLLGSAFARQNWADGLDARGRPLARPAATPTRTGVLVYPSASGATNWWAASYHPQLGLLYVPTADRGAIFFSTSEREVDAVGATNGGNTSEVPGERSVTAVVALELATGRVRWRYERPPRSRFAQMGGLLSTAGGVVFGSDLDTIFALDAANGRALWGFNAGAQVRAAPVSYRIGGRQYVAVAAGHSILAFALPPD